LDSGTRRHFLPPPPARHDRHRPVLPCGKGPKTQSIRHDRALGWHGPGRRRGSGHVESANRRWRMHRRRSHASHDLEESR
jgi:hypothetical protein